ncbi:SDR family NAD(P)-dependent oxidoreductase [Pseudohoeflea coraliihabitans]|uniref:SDR family oxidoreductase n=1 Tax=Pseudohoeflea coraliihabitans TaxID=2860393 RepID=A0ABS6WKY1_9HYPH|nr:SDR family NAD(P)-dependent oxidoreductase [Pseudohoeflea sp. DP4N28-3]MBW3096440.1 SDR family oxidoreductase [Pseudohoeflea sp. DP4N28-3]
MAGAAERVAVLTGAGGGIGQGLAHRFAEAGYRLVLIDRTAPEIADLPCAADDVIALAADVCDPGSLAATATESLARFGGVHVVIANAGIGPSGGLADTDLSAWQAAIAVNLTGTFNTLQAFLPALRQAAGHRAVVMMASVLATRGAGNMAAYSASKAGVLGLLQASAQELAPEGITVNGLAPGPIRTPMLEEIAGDTLNELAQTVPVRRLGTPRDVAEAALFFAGEGSSFITGQHLVIDGGLNGRAYWRDAPRSQAGNDRLTRGGRA